MALGGLDLPRATDRLFFAVFPDAVTAARIVDIAQALRDSLGLRGKPLRADRLHVTLHHLGDYAGLPQDVLAMAREAAAGVEAPGFEVGFDRASSFNGKPRNHPFVLLGDTGVAALRKLQSALGRSLAGAGLGRLLGSEFTPHVTLLYDDRVITSQAIDPIAWRVNEFVLVHSLLGQGERRILGRWPFTAARVDLE
jgi:2'-5' RNA ligase